MAKRTSIEIPGMGHGAPIPMGSKIGNTLYSSGISGFDCEIGLMPESAEEQAVQMFKNVATLLQQAGSSPEDVIRMTLLMQDRKDLVAINPEWVKMFPDEHSRPARHAVELSARAGIALLQAEIVAILD